jgi:hypothetical protein
MEGLYTLDQAHKELAGVAKQTIKNNNSIGKVFLDGKIYYKQEDVLRYQQELNMRKKIRINHIKPGKKFIEIDREKYSTCYDLSKLLNINPVTIHSILKKKKLKYEDWNNAKFFIKLDAMEILKNHVLHKKNRKKKDEQ